MKLKWCIFTGLFAFGIFLPYSLKAEPAPHNSGKKIYVTVKQITINDEAIFVELPKGVFETTKLGKDEKGYYVYAKALYAPKGAKLWSCPHCGASSMSRSEIEKHIREKHK